MTKARENSDYTGLAADIVAGDTAARAGRKNLIINGSMQISQRGTSFTGMTSSGTYGLDRYSHSIASAGTWSITKSSNAPSGFASSHRAEVTTAGLSGTGSYISLSYKIEAQDLQSLGYGTSGAKTSAISFWVKSSNIGNYSVWLYKYDGGRTISKTVTIDTANTWEHKSVVIDADTTGAIANDNTSGILLRLYYAAGSDYTSGTQQTNWGSGGDACDSSQVNLASTIGNYIEITGLQLEVGSVATDFEHRSYGEELALCQRYYHYVNQGNEQFNHIGSNYTTSNCYFKVQFPVTMRANPTGASTATANTYSAGSNIGANKPVTAALATTLSAQCFTSSLSGTAGYVSHIDLASGSITFDAEL